MLQIDCLLTFAIGSSLATAAGDGLKANNYHTQNRYFVYFLLHMSMIVTPLNVYMLWEHTGFETMFYYDASMHGFYPAINIFLFTLSGIVGFMTGRKLVRLNQELTAYTVWTAAYTVVLAVVGCHYDRFLYPGGMREFYEGKKFEIKEFLQSELCTTLSVSLVLMAGPVFYAQLTWPREEGLMTKTRKSTIKWHCVSRFIQGGLLAAATYTVLKVAHITPKEWGWDRIPAILAAQLLGFILLLPIFLMQTRYVVTTRIDIRKSKQNIPMSNRRRRPSRNSNTTNTNHILDEEWEEVSMDLAQEQTTPTVVHMNGGSNGHIPNKDE